MSGRIVGQMDTPWHLWVVGALSLLWNAGGMFSWYTIMLGDPDAMGFSPALREYLDAYPAWALGAYTMGTWGAFLGSLLLLARRKLASIAFAVALIGLAGTTLYERAVASLPPEFQTPGQTVFTLVIWATTIALFFYARWLAGRGVLR